MYTFQIVTGRDISCGSHMWMSAGQLCTDAYVDLWTSDDGSGRQRWVLDPVVLSQSPSDSSSFSGASFSTSVFATSSSSIPHSSTLLSSSSYFSFGSSPTHPSSSNPVSSSNSVSSSSNTVSSSISSSNSVSSPTPSPSKPNVGAIVGGVIGGLFLLLLLLAGILCFVHKRRHKGIEPTSAFEPVMHPPTSNSTWAVNHPGWNSAKSRHRPSTTATSLSISTISSFEALNLVNEVHNLRIAEVLHRDYSLAAQ